MSHKDEDLVPRGGW